MSKLYASIAIVALAVAGIVSAVGCGDTISGPEFNNSGDVVWNDGDVSVGDDNEGDIDNGEDNPPQCCPEGGEPPTTTRGAGGEFIP